MANLITLAERIEKLKVKNGKTEKKIERQAKQFDKMIKELKDNGCDLKGDYSILKTARLTDRTEFSYAMYTLNGHMKDMEETKNLLAHDRERLEKLNSQVQELQVKEESALLVVPEAVKIFMDNWEEQVIEWTLDKYRRGREISKSVRENYKSYIQREEEKEGKKLSVNEILDLGYGEKHVIKAIIANMSNLAYMMMNTYGISEKGEKAILKVIAEEKQEKIVSLLEKIKEVTGEILDASCLDIGDDGNINGYIYGKKGNAKVQTIGAGGYNVQVYHYRVLVHKF